MDALETAILRTVLYGDIFSFPMTVEEIHHFLIYDQPVSLAEVKTVLAQSPHMRQHLEFEQGYCARAGRRPMIKLRAARAQASRRLWPTALYYGTWLARLPFVRMVAVTGALAMHNPINAHDDLDFMVITSEHRVWLARAFSILLVRLARLQGVMLCPNYVLAENVLEQRRQDLYIAHEIAQMAPVYGHALYHQFREANVWVLDHLPNAAFPFNHQPELQVSGFWWLVKCGLEHLLRGKLGDRLETWEYQRKLRRFSPQMRALHAAELDESHVKGHFNDYGHPILRQYFERLHEHGVEHTPASAPGD